MDRNSRGGGYLRLAVTLAPICLGAALACDDNDAIEPPPSGETGGAGGESSGTTGGTSGTGGNAGDGGSANTGGAAATGGRSGDGGTSATGGVRSSGGQNTGGAAPDTDGSAPEGGTPDGGSCSGELDPTHANLCLTFAPETVTFQGTPDLDGKGTLIVTVFRTAAPTGVADVIETKYYPEPPSASAATVELGRLPAVGFSGLPETVYVQTRFVDNLAGLASASGLSYGMFVGGVELADGVRPPPTGRPSLRKVDLKNGEETAVSQRLTALRKFTTSVVLSLPPSSQPADDAQGPLSVGVFAQRAPAGAPVFGGGEIACVDMLKGPVPVTGFFYVLTMPAAGADVHFGGQLDDFAKRAITPPGAIVSFDSSQLIPADQTVHVVPEAYSVHNDHVALTFVLGGFAGSTPFACPVVAPPPDAGDGSDGG